MASTYLTKYNSATASTNQYKGTFSFWVKKSSGNYLFSQGDNTSGGSAIERILFYMNTGGNLGGGFRGSGGSPDIDMTVSGKYRDCNGWYHVVYAYDTSLSTGSERVRVYVNNVEQTVTWTGNASAVPQNTVFPLNKTSYSVPLYIGSFMSDGSFFDGIMSHINYVDGQQLTPSSFGEYDANGVWKAKTSPSVTYGTNGFFILKDGNSVTDQSGNGNNFTVGGGTLTNTEDCPGNVFCTMNPLQLPFPTAGSTFSFGNTKVAGNNADWQRVYGTIGATTGKWFYEFKNLQNNGQTGECRIGWDSIDHINASTSNYYSGLTIDRAGILRGGILGTGAYSPNEVQMTAAYSGGNFSYTNGDILGMAIDLDNETFSVYKNGNLEINAYSYAGLSNNSISKSRGYFIAPSFNWYSSASDNNRSCFNFGNGYFETTAVSSAGTNASGIGIFEYDVPTGYTAWSTKGLNL